MMLRRPGPRRRRVRHARGTLHPRPRRPFLRTAALEARHRRTGRRDPRRVGDIGGRSRQQHAVPRVPGVPGAPVTATEATGEVAEDEQRKATDRSGSVLRSGAVMAAGSIVSRATGFIRSAVVVAALGTGLQADGYAVANTVPNILYMLLIGGALNAVFVPELVRAAKEHADGGAAYTDRLLTACAVGLVALTATACRRRPADRRVYTDYSGEQAAASPSRWPATACRRSSSTGCSRCSGQVLNARGRFGAMMWTPVLNNLVDHRRVRAVSGRRAGRRRHAHRRRDPVARLGHDRRDRRPDARPGARAARRPLPLAAPLRLARQRTRPGRCGRPAGS